MTHVCALWEGLFEVETLDSGFSTLLSGPREEFRVMRSGGDEAEVLLKARVRLVK